MQMSRIGDLFCPVASQKCMLLVTAADLIFAQVLLKEIGLLFLIYAGSDSSTARAVGSKQGASRKMKHIQTRFLFILELVFRKFLTMSSVKTDVNPSEIGTKALRRERFHRLRSMVGMGTELSETSSSGNVAVATNDSGNLWTRVWIEWTSRIIDTC